MTKIFQKSLASVLALALCLTALITASATVSAEEGTSTTAPTLEYVVTPASPKKGETVKVELVAKNFNDVTIFGADIATYYDSKLELTADNITFGFKDGYETVTVDKSFDAVNKKIGIVGLGGYENGVYTPFLDNFNSTTLYSFEFVAGDAGTEYTFSFASDTKVRFCTSGEEKVDVTANAASVTVAEDAHTHTWGDLQYSVEDGKCITKHVCTECGTEEIIASVANANVENALNLSYGIAIRFRVLKSDIAGYVDGSVVGKINHDVYTGENTLSGQSDTLEIVPTNAGTTSKPKWQFEYEGLTAKEMLSQIHVKVFATDTDGNVILVAASDFVIGDYLKSNYLNKPTTSAAYKKLAADMLRYGAESQKAFKYRTGALPTEGVGESEFSVLPTEFTNTDKTSTGINIETSTVLSNRVTFRFRVLKSNVSSYDFSNLHYTIQYNNSQGVEQTYPATERDIAEAVIISGSNTKYQFDFSRMPVATINDYMTIKLWNGEEEIGSLVYSFQNYAASAYANTSNPYATLSRAICAYGASAAAAFAS